MNSNIRKLRNEKNITQSTLADILGKTQQTISHMERDRDRIPIESLITLADYFEVSTDYILGVEPKDNPKDKSTGNMLTEVLNSSVLSNTENLCVHIGSMNNISGENRREILYQLILSLLLYSLENGTEAAAPVKEA